MTQTILATQHIYAIETKKGTEARYYLDNLHTILHCEDGPAVITTNSEEWWLHGKLHRIGGPALEYSNGEKHWRVEGEKHRLDGSAIEKSRNRKVWYLFNIETTQEEVKHFYTSLLLQFSGKDIKDVPYHVLKVIYTHYKGAPLE